MEVIVKGIEELNLLGARILDKSIPPPEELTIVDAPDLREIPYWVYELPSLKVLRVNRTGIGGPNVLISQLGKTLETLDLNNNNIVGLYDGFGPEMVALKELLLNNNRLEGLPKTIGTCPILKRIEVSHHSDRFPFLLPKAIGNLAQLEKLDASFGTIQTLPLEMKNNTLLKTLNLESNRITTLPPCITHMAFSGSLESLNLLANPIPPIEIKSIKETIKIKELLI